MQALLQRGQGDVGVVSERIHGDWPHHPQRVGELLAGFRAAQAAELRVGFGDHVGVEKLPQLHGAQELGQQRRVEREGGGALFGERGVALVHEGAGVVEQQRGGERARLVRGHLRDADAARGQLAHDLLERGQVVDVLEALADRLQDDGERRVVARDVEQLLRALALLPQWRALARVAARQEQGAGGALAEAGREQGGVADLLGDDVGDLVSVELEERPVRLLLPLRQAQHNAVVARDGLGVHAGLLCDAPAGGQRPGGVNALAKGGVQDHAPVAQLVGETLEHQRLLVRQHAGGFLLLLQVGDEVGAGELVERRVDALARARLAAELAERLAQLVWATQAVAVPEREPARVAGRGRDLHLVAGDVLDAPARRAEGKHVAHARLVDHLLVQLADAAGCFVVGTEQEHAEHAAVRDRARVRHRHALRARPGFQRRALQNGAGPKLREVGRRVDPSDQVDHGVENFARQVPVGPGAAHSVEPIVYVKVLERDRGDRLLREHVQRAARGVQLLDRALAHPRHRHRSLHQVGAVLGVEAALRDRAHGVPGAADTLQPRGH